MEEKRKHKRYRLETTDLNGKMSLAEKVEIIDISVGGVALKADRRLNPGREYVLRLGDKWKTIEVIGVVVRSALSGFETRSDGAQVAVYSAGMKFRQDTAEAINEFLKSMTVSRKEILPTAVDRRCSVRFKITMPGAKILSYPANFSVKEISQSGFRIETDQRLEKGSVIPMTLSLNNDETDHFNGRVASCTPISTSPEDDRYEVGVAFLDLTEKDRNLLKEFIGYLAEMEKNGSRGAECR
ncbi:MAG TPA: PilZ domain-containing protein [Nitrospirota bacterium]|nr:PilZ domain-containing protein [Nitrospirota bacterium]